MLIGGEVAEHAHARARVERLLYLGRHRDVHDHELRNFEPVLVVDPLVHEQAHLLGERWVVRGELEHTEFRLRHHVCEALVDDRAHELVDLVGRILAARADQLREQPLRIDRAQRVGAERAHAHRAELAVAHRHRVGRAPAQVGDLARADEVDLGLERAVEAVHPTAERREHRQVARLEPVLARAEHVGDPSLVHEHGHLARAHDQLRAVLDLVVVAREAPDEGAPAVVDPFDDVDQLGA